MAECYYFDVNGYMAENTVIDGYTVDVNGAWTVNGVVQTKQVDAQQNGDPAQTTDDDGESNQSNNTENTGSDVDNPFAGAKPFFIGGGEITGGGSGATADIPMYG